MISKIIFLEEKRLDVIRGKLSLVPLWDDKLMQERKQKRKREKNLLVSEEDPT